MTKKLIITISFAVFYLTSALSASGQSEAASNINPITDAAVQTGALTCAARVEQVTNYLGITSDTQAIIHSPQGATDTTGLSVAMTVMTDGVIGLATIDFVPMAGGCVATYSLITSFEDSCDTVSARTLPEDAAGTPLGDSIVAFNGPNSVRLYFMEVPSGCSVTKIETVR